MQEQRTLISARHCKIIMISFNVASTIFSKRNKFMLKFISLSHLIYFKRNKNYGKEW